ncbi:hypothetical protein [Amycolatopsis sp. WGS_07]|uniref:hypothetical protein n=1 Tax=Amycolatopsis sp. WGS_07 TaxID=3076764 RepID=UPI003872D8F6
MIAKHTIVSGIAAVSLALGLSLVSSGAANASVRETGPCNGASQPITDNFEHPGAKLCGSRAVVVDFGGGNIINVVIGVVGDSRPVYADGGSGWHQVGNGLAYHENSCHRPIEIGVDLDPAQHVIRVIGTDNHYYTAKAKPDNTFEPWNRGRYEVACHG